MSTMVIGDYSAAVSIDGSTNYLLIQPGNSSTAYNKINRNVFLGVTGQPMDISTAQNVTNKTLDNTNTLTLKDTLFTLQDDGDTTKQAKFQLSGITTGTTRTYTLPNASSTLVDLSTSQTLTNKTLTSPTISGGSITGSTITTDAIVGQTVSTNGTVYGLSITGGKISGTAISAGTIGSTALATNAVQANQLATNAITLGFASITTTFSTSSATAVQVTGLTTTVTIPSGSRRVKITVWANFVDTASSAFVTLSLWDGPVVSGTMLSQSQPDFVSGGTRQLPISVIAVVSPSAGSKTYNVGLSTTAGTVGLAAAATYPAFILVEAI